MTLHEGGFGSSIPAGPEGDPLRAEAGQYPAWRAMHGRPDEEVAGEGVAATNPQPVPAFEGKVYGDGSPVPVRELGHQAAAHCGVER